MPLDQELNRLRTQLGGSRPKPGFEMTAQRDPGARTTTAPIRRPIRPRTQELQPPDPQQVALELLRKQQQMQRRKSDLQRMASPRVAQRTEQRLKAMAQRGIQPNPKQLATLRRIGILREPVKRSKVRSILDI